MAKYSESFIQQVQQATDIVDLISGYVALKKRGKEFVGLCPFHEDTHPSLNVSPAKQIFKCFACGAGGSAFNFVMLYEKLSFPEAVRNLAERANIPLPRDAARPAPAGMGKTELLGVATFAARFYRDQLNSPAGAAALGYARGRGLSDQSIRRFGLGFAPDAWDALAAAAREHGISEAQLVAAGLATPRETAGCYDRFRNRLMFPILNVSGSVVAFGGRALDEAERAKYLNSPETVLFDKSSVLYALNWSRQAIVSSGRAAVVEGYLDALLPLQAGVENVVATLGTALTERHVHLLARYARDVVLVFDADAAGAAAAERALETFLTQQVRVRVATIPAGKDPCDFVQAEGAEALTKLIDEAPDALHHAWTRMCESYKAAGDNLADRREIVEAFLRLVASSAAYGAIDEVRRGQLAQHIAHMLNVPSAELLRQMRRLSRQVRRGSLGGGGPSAAPAAPTLLGQRQVLEVLLNEPELFDLAAERIGPADFSDAALRAVAERVWSLGSSGRLALDEVVASEAMAAHGALVAELATAGERRGNYEPTLVGAVDLMLYYRGKKDLDDLKAGGLSDETLRAIQQWHRQSSVRRGPRIS
jgi:DNA primase